jgi:hypothetical protein
VSRRLRTDDGSVLVERRRPLGGLRAQRRPEHAAAGHRRSPSRAPRSWWAMATIAEYLRTVRLRLESEGYAWIDGLTNRTNEFQAAAKRRRFELSKLGMSTSFFIFKSFDRLDVDSARSFAEIAFAYANRNRGGFLPRGVFEGVFCFAVAIAGEAEADAVHWVRKQTPPKHWAGTTIPVIVAHPSDELHFLQKTPAWGAAYWRGFRDTAQRILTPS